MSVTSVMQEAGKVVKKAVGVAPDESTRDLLDTLKAEHDEVKALLNDLEDAETGPQRKALVRKIKVALIPMLRQRKKYSMPRSSR